MMDARQIEQEVLAEIKIHSESLRDPSIKKVNAESEITEITASGDGWTPKMWRFAFERLFLGEKPHCRSSGHDDLLFFVRKQEQGKPTSFFVRRWSKDLPEEVPDPEAPQEALTLNRGVADLNWRESLYLNLVLHTTYVLTVAICSRSAIEAKKQGSGSAWSPLVKVAKSVFSSPTRISVDSKEEFSKPSYPIIFFAVEDYDQAFQSLVLTDPDHCLCVLLSARGGPAFPPAPEGQEGAASDESLKSRVLLFSGFVGYQQLKGAYQAGHRRWGGLLPGRPGEAARVLMKGPGGNGEAEVAVTDAEAAMQENANAVGVAGGEGSNSRGKNLFGGSMRRAIASATNVAGQVAHGVLGRPQSASSGDLQLQCSLMSISLPWWCLTHDILFRPFS